MLAPVYCRPTGASEFFSHNKDSTLGLVGVVVYNDDEQIKARPSHIINQNGLQVASGFKRIASAVFYRIPAPFVPGIPNKTRLESSIKRFFNPHLTYDCLPGLGMGNKPSRESNLLASLSTHRTPRLALCLERCTATHISTPHASSTSLCL